MIVVFHRYAKEGGNKTTLSKKELKKLIENELPSFLKVRLLCHPPRLEAGGKLCVFNFAPSVSCQSQKSPDTVERIIKDLDENKDDELDFEEFLPFVAGITIACEKHFALSQEQKGKK